MEKWNLSKNSDDLLFRYFLGPLELALKIEVWHVGIWPLKPPILWNDYGNFMGYDIIKILTIYVNMICIIDGNVEHHGNIMRVV